MRLGKNRLCGGLSSSSAASDVQKDSCPVLGLVASSDLSDGYTGSGIPLDKWVETATENLM